MRYRLETDEAELESEAPLAGGPQRIGAAGETPPLGTRVGTQA